MQCKNIYPRRSHVIRYLIAHEFSKFLLYDQPITFPNPLLGCHMQTNIFLSPRVFHHLHQMHSFLFMLCFLHCCLKTLMHNKKTLESNITKTLEHKNYFYFNTYYILYLKSKHFYNKKFDTQLWESGSLYMFLRAPIHKFHQQPLPPNATIAKTHQEKLNKPLFLQSS